MTLGPGVASRSTALFGAAGAITPGAIWNFQCWYRDPTGPCGTAFDLPNGVVVQFSP